ncbi:MAG TPA: hypothetical protein VH599_09935 [Ktedonobacterales bacterium]
MSLSPRSSLFGVSLVESVADPASRWDVSSVLMVSGRWSRFLQDRCPDGVGIGDEGWGGLAVKTAPGRAALSRPTLAIEIAARGVCGRHKARLRGLGREMS